MAEYKYFKDFQEMYAYARGKVKVIEPIEVKPKKKAEKPAEQPADEEPKKKGRKKKGEV